MSDIKCIENPQGFYAYLHCKPDGAPFYIGKGKDDRIKLYNNRNQFHSNIVSKYGQDNILVGGIECSSEQIAFDLEVGLIKLLKKQGYKLANMTEGGEGSTGATKSEEEKLRISKKLKGCKKEWFSEQLKERQANGGYTKGMKFSNEQKKNMGAKIGHTTTEETKQKIAHSNKNREPLVCTVCGMSSTTYGGMKRYHFENCKGSRQYSSRVQINGERIFLGSFATKEEAEEHAKDFKDLVLQEMEVK